MLRPWNRRQFIAGSIAAPFVATEVAADALPPSAYRPGSELPAYGVPASGERYVRRVISEDRKIAKTPLAAQRGIITPSGLFFTRTHAGVPKIESRNHRLLVHGAVARPVFLTMHDILRYPSTTRIAFIECAGNTSQEWNAPSGRTVSETHGLASCAEWTGVPLRMILEDVGAHTAARWLLAEGADGASYDRSIPRDLAESEALIVYAQNGEMLRPEQGYPLRLVLPGLSGSASVKWLSRIALMEAPVYSREDTARYSEDLPDGRVRPFAFELGPKSVVTMPSGEMRLEDHGTYQIAGFAWSGAGSIRAVDISIDGGVTWREAHLDEPVLSKAFTRFTGEFRWTGEAATVLSRATDEHGTRQPTREELIALRGPTMSYRYNAIHGWKVRADGRVARQWDN